jgi:PAS domain S-box-containing protein
VAGVAVLREVTAERRLEQEALELEARFRHMADGSPVMLWMSGLDTLCNFFNQTWLDFTGRRLDEELGVGWAEGVHAEDLSRCMDTYLAAFGRRERFEMEYRLRRHDGAYRWILDRGVPRYLPDGTFAGYIGSCVDITDRRQLETDLRSAVNARDEFLSIAAHELRTPLTPLTLYVDQLVRSVRRGNAQSPLARLEQLSALVDRHTRMVEDLLDISRISSGPVSLEPRDMDFAEVAAGAARQLGEAARVAGVELRIAVTAPIPGRWDPGRVEQVVRNLVSNAIKYGAGQPVDVLIEDVGQTVRLVVRDHGIGIEPEDQTRLFERFERAASARGYSGFGLGLWITRRVLHAMGGTISVESHPSLADGTRFVVEVPRA